MLRRSIVHVLLSLLLLVSQQLAFSHGLSHWPGGRDGSAQLQQKNDSRSSDSANTSVLDQPCHQCLAFAQIAAVIGSSFAVFAATDGAFACIASSTATPACQRAVRYFQPRAPPQA